MLSLREGLVYLSFTERPSWTNALLNGFALLFFLLFFSLKATLAANILLGKIFLTTFWTISTDFKQTLWVPREVDLFT